MCYFTKEVAAQCDSCSEAVAGAMVLPSMVPPSGLCVEAAVAFCGSFCGLATYTPLWLNLFSPLFRCDPGVAKTFRRNTTDTAWQRGSCMRPYYKTVT